MNWLSKWPEPAAIIYEPGRSIKQLGSEALPTGVKETFHFQDGNKRRSIDVTIVGDLALDYDDDGWNVYHVPTGTVFTKAVPGYIVHSEDCISHTPNDINYCTTLNKCIDNTSYEQSELLAWMKKVQEQYGTAWTMLRLLTPDNYQDKGESAKRIIKEWCLSVQVKE